MVVRKSYPTPFLNNQATPTNRASSAIIGNNLREKQFFEITYWKQRLWGERAPRNQKGSNTGDFFLTFYFVLGYACWLSHFSRVQFFATLQTVARQAPLSIAFLKQEYWSGLPCPSPGDLPDPGIEPTSLTSPAGVFWTTSATWEVYWGITD